MPAIIALIPTIIKYLPELISLIKYLKKETDDGVDEIRIRRNFKRLDKSVANPNRPEAAREANDVFRN